MRSHDAAGRSYVGQNSFGARAGVEVSRRTDDALFFEISPLHDPIVEAYKASIALPPSQAKLAAHDARAIISGTIGGDGRTTDCESRYNAPTVDAPLEVRVSTCWVRVRVQRIAIVRKSTGQVLDEWLTKPSAE